MSLIYHFSDYAISVRPKPNFEGVDSVIFVVRGRGREGTYSANGKYSIALTLPDPELDLRSATTVGNNIIAIHGC